MYAEGDTISAGNDQAILLKNVLTQIVDKLKDENGDIFVPLLYFIFEKEIAKFYTTKKLTKGFKNGENNNDNSVSDVGPASEQDDPGSSDDEIVEF